MFTLDEECTPLRWIGRFVDTGIDVGVVCRPQALEALVVDGEVGQVSGDLPIAEHVTCGGRRRTRLRWQRTCWFTARGGEDHPANVNASGLPRECSGHAGVHT